MFQKMQKVLMPLYVSEMEQMRDGSKTLDIMALNDAANM